MGFNPFPETFIRKTANESVTSSIVVQNDDELKISIGSNEVIQFDFVLYTTGIAAGDFKCALTAPAGATGMWGIRGLEVPTGGPLGSNMSSAGKTLFDGTGTVSSGLSVGTVCPAFLKGIMVNGATAGVLQLQWAQNVSNATATVVNANSYLRAIKFK